MPTVHERTEEKRGCGYRQPGGIYLVGSARSRGCCKLPWPLTVCPTCHAGIKPQRGFQWVEPAIFAGADCNEETPCPLDTFSYGYPQKIGLMWVGEKFYPSAAHFVQEAARQGVSKRLSAVPLDFVVGQDWVALAHRAAIVDYTDGMQAWVDQDS